MMKPTILIVEDNDSIRVSLRDWLNTIFLDGHSLEAKSGEEAVAAACLQKPDVVLMEIELPQMNGIDATRNIKDVLPKTHIVMLTTHENSRYKIEAIKAGASAYVTKRKMHSQLIPTLKGLLFP